MVGICGVVGGRSEAIRPMLTWLSVTGEERHVDVDDSDGAVALRGAFHPQLVDGQPGRAGPDLKLLLRGNVYGGKESNGPEYVSRRMTHPTCSAVDYLAERYAEGGNEALAATNGVFAAVAYDSVAGTVSLITDRLGSKPLFYTRCDDGSVAFSTNIQSLAQHPSVTPAFDLEYLVEYLTYERAFGVKTPLEGVEKVPPGSVLTIDVESLSVSVDRYWYPAHEPVDRPWSYFVHEFVDRFRAALADRTVDDLAYGLLLSGGSDSRLIAGELGPLATAYHLTGWMSEETQTAREVATTAGCQFVPLWRDREYQAASLERTPRLSNFIGGFDEGHATGFADRLRGEVDVVLSGHLADTLFDGTYLPRRRLPIPLPGFDSIELPVMQEIGDLEEFLDYRSEPGPMSLSGAPSPREVLERNIQVDDEGVVSHGVRYRSISELILCEEYYPRTNAKPFFEYTTDQFVPLRMPFMDARLIDLHLSMPLRYFLRKDLVGDALDLVAPELASIPHPDTGRPLRASFLAHHVGRLWTTVRRDYLPGNEPPAPHLSHGPWPNNAELIRTHDFVETALERNDDLLQALPYLDSDGAWECYHAHLDGANKTQRLYPLLTLLEMPVTAQVAGACRRSNESTAENPVIRNEPSDEDR